ncbi:MAG: prepilin peptidase [Planctomycetota bacterium]
MHRIQRRLHQHLPLLATLAAICLGSVIHILGVGWVLERLYPSFAYSEIVKARIIEVFYFIWSFWVGSAIGSYLNVVAWRLPRNLSIGGRSHCPRCGSQLRARDNIPFFGWIGVRGRCFNCGLPISKRYPIVEAIVGLCVAAVVVASLYRWSIPGYIIEYKTGPLRTAFLSPTLVALIVFHIYAVASSFAVGLVRMDGNRLPVRLVTWCLIPLVTGILVYPPFGVVTWRTGEPPIEWTSVSRYIDALIRVITAFVASAILSRSLARGLYPQADPKLDPLGKSTIRLMDVFVMLSIPSIVLGWQSFVGFLVFSSVAVAIGRVVFRPTLGERDAMECFSITLPVAFTLHLVFWNVLRNQSWYPSDESEPVIVLVWGAAALFVPTWLRDKSMNG